jgi:putative zinc finger/helix-turn-helix YgiT family protein
MAERRFPKKCGVCQQRAMALAVVPYSIQIDHDGRKYQVEIPSLEVPKCGNCGEFVIDDEAGKVIQAAFHAKADLLTPDDIARVINDAHLNQKEFAELIGISQSTLSRWVNGVQVQQRGYDNIIRAFDKVPELRAFLASRLTTPSATPHGELVPRVADSTHTVVRIHPKPKDNMANYLQAAAPRIAAGVAIAATFGS